MRVTYSAVVVVLSFGIANLGAYAAISACEQYRLCRIGTIRSRYVPAWAYLFVMSICLGGVGIWCMHFVGMSAVSMFDDSGTLIEVRYDLGLTLLSLALVIVFSTIGFYISCRDIIFMKTKREIMEMFIKNAHNISMKSVQHFGTKDILPVILTKSTNRLMLGGAFTGSGVVIMHYVGMAAMKFPGRIVWNIGEVAASVVVAFVAATAAFWILFRLLSIYANKENLRLVCSITMSVAVCGMHYLGMAAATFHLDPSVTVDIKSTFSSTDAFFAGIVVSAIVISLSAVLVLADLRYSVQRLSNELYIADALVKGMPAAPNSSSAIAIHRYIHHRRTTKFSLGVLNDTMQLEQADDANSVSSREDNSEHPGGGVSRYLPAWVHRLVNSHAFYGETSVQAETSEHSGYHYAEQGRPNLKVSNKPSQSPHPHPHNAPLRTSSTLTIEQGGGCDEAALDSQRTINNSSSSQRTTTVGYKGPNGKAPRSAPTALGGHASIDNSGGQGVAQLERNKRVGSPSCCSAELTVSSDAAAAIAGAALHTLTEEQ